MRYYESLDHSFRCYEQLMVMYDMNNLGSYEFKPLDHTDSLRLLIIRMILGHEPKARNVMNNSRL